MNSFDLIIVGMNFTTLFMLVYTAFAFSESAKNIGRKPVKWAFIGGAAFLTIYVISIFALYHAAEIIRTGKITAIQNQMNLVTLACGFIIATLASYFLKRNLLNPKSNQHSISTNIDGSRNDDTYHEINIYVDGDASWTHIHLLLWFCNCIWWMLSTTHYVSKYLIATILFTLAALKAAIGSFDGTPALISVGNGIIGLAYVWILGNLGVLVINWVTKAAGRTGLRVANYSSIIIVSIIGVIAIPNLSRSYSTIPTPTALTEPAMRTEIQPVRKKINPPESISLESLDPANQ